MLQLGGVTHVVALHADTFADLSPVAALPGLYDEPVRLFAVPDPMPRTYVASSVRAAEGLAAVGLLPDPGFDFRREVLLPPGAAPGPARARGVSRVGEEDPSSVAIEVETETGGYVVLLDSFDPGWRATVDGDPAAVLPANGLFRAVLVPPGRHRVRFAYRPPVQAAGLASTALAAGLLVLGGVRVARGRGAGTP
jgi:hypothetical protein